VLPGADRSAVVDGEQTKATTSSASSLQMCRPLLNGVVWIASVVAEPSPSGRRALRPGPPKRAHHRDGHAQAYEHCPPFRTAQDVESHDRGAQLALGLPDLLALSLRSADLPCVRHGHCDLEMMAAPGRRCGHTFSRAPGSYHYCRSFRKHPMFQPLAVCRPMCANSAEGRSDEQDSAALHGVAGAAPCGWQERARDLRQ